jgi:diguanylate cyclase (GGDEF)-like protein
MDPQVNNSKLEAIGQAAGAGVAIVVIDAHKRVLETFNDNSICSSLNPKGSLCVACDRYCGAIPQRVALSQKSEPYECHAGLSCRAVPVNIGPNAAVVVGRTFVSSERYKAATERSINGDWAAFPAGPLFENVLITGSERTIDEVATRLTKQFPSVDIPAAAMKTEVLSAPPGAETRSEPDTETTCDQSHQAALVEKFDREAGDGDVLEIVVERDTTYAPRSAPEPSMLRVDLSDWRSFFSGMLELDLLTAAKEIAARIANTYGFRSTVWLERKGGLFEQLTTSGDLEGRRIKLGVSPDDERLVAALRDDTPLELREKPRNARQGGRIRTLTMFPIGLAGQPQAALAILDEIDSELTRNTILKILRIAAPQLEILRLRNAVMVRDNFTEMIRRFSESLRKNDDDDIWLRLTQNTAELLEAERSSLLIFDDKQETLALRSMIGSATPPETGSPAGERVSLRVFERGQPALVTDLATTRLEPEPDGRSYRSSSFLSCPIRVGGKTIGVMNFTDRVGGQPFDKRSYELFQAISPQLAVAADRALLKERAREFEQLSVTDPLTGLLNRRYIQARLAEEVKRSNRDGSPMSFLMLDVDKFKAYNDNFGHPAGDVALKLVGQVIRDTLRGADVAARYGGEEFAILLPATTGEEALAIAERIRHNVAHTAFPHRKVTASIGAASCSARLCVAGDLVDAADRALYQAKERGRDRVVAFEQLAPAGGRQGV